MYPRLSYFRLFLAFAVVIFHVWRPMAPQSGRIAVMLFFLRERIPDRKVADRDIFLPGAPKLLFVTDFSEFTQFIGAAVCLGWLLLRLSLM